MTEPAGTSPYNDGLLAAIAAVRALMSGDMDALGALTGPDTPELTGGLLALAGGSVLAVSDRLGVPFDDYLDRLARTIIMETPAG